ncbi:hypothetical protein ACHQM5_016014 [Ranunculus cassubicifolius]
MMRSNSSDGDDNPNANEWLDLSLGRNDPLTVGDSDSASKPTSNKIFSCNFCMRKFFSSQALGGHQNAHKRERGAVRRYQSQRMAAMMGLLPFNTPIARSLSVQAHSLIQKPSKEGTMSPWAAPFFFDEAMGTMWPGSFRVNQQPPEQHSELLKLDLNLAL